MIVYHGSIIELPLPDVLHSQKYLDFGKGFYTTTYCEQAEKWALRKRMRSRNADRAIVNVYEFTESTQDICIRRFSDEDRDWLEYVCACRKGADPDDHSDIIIGSVADDDVFKTVDMYFRGLWDIDRTMQELRFYRSNNQIVFKNNAAITRSLHFKEAYEVTR